MSVKIKKVNLMPVRSSEEVSFYCEQILRQLKGARKILDDYGAKYDHETPWKRKYITDAEFYLYRVRIGAIGRINNCKDAVLIGLGCKTRILCHHFTSVGLYSLARLARQVQRKHVYLKRLEEWLNNYLNDEKGQFTNSRFVNYHDVPIEDET